MNQKWKHFGIPNGSEKSQGTLHRLWFSVDDGCCTAQYLLPFLFFFNFFLNFNLKVDFSTRTSYIRMKVLLNQNVHNLLPENLNLIIYMFKFSVLSHRKKVSYRYKQHFYMKSKDLFFPTFYLHPSLGPQKWPFSASQPSRLIGWVFPASKFFRRQKLFIYKKLFIFYYFQFLFRRRYSKQLIWLFKFNS